MHSPTSLNTILFSPLIEESEVDPINMAFSVVNGDTNNGVGNKLDFYPAVDEEYESRRAEQQAESLVPLKEDLADWLQRILDIAITTETFMEALDNGAAICRLAHLIQLKAEAAFKDGKYTEAIPKLKFRYRENAKSGTWFARDNAANFLRWCRDFGINEGCMFESEDLVCHRQEKPVVVCLLELARIGYKFGMESPSIIKIEKEIELEESELASQINEDDIHNLNELANLTLTMESVATQVSRTASMETNVEAANENEASENEAGSRKATADGEDAEDGEEGEAEGEAKGKAEGEGDAEGDGEADEVKDVRQSRGNYLVKTEEETQETSNEKDGETRSMSTNESEVGKQQNSVNGEDENGEEVEEKEDGGKGEHEGQEGEDAEQIDGKGSMMLNGEDDFTQSNEGIVSEGEGDGEDEQDTNASHASESTSVCEDESNLRLNCTLEDINENDAEHDSVESKTPSSPVRNNNDVGGQFHKKTSITPQARTDSLKARQLDKKVKSIASQHNVSDQVSQISEGKYSIFGRVVFIRLLKEKHLMVRVGGGWDTLEHYLSHHNPTKIIEFKRTDQPKSSSTNSRHDPDTGETALTSAISADDKYLLIVGKYKKN